MVLEKFFSRKKEEKKVRLVPKFPQILFARGETPKILRKLFTDARKKLKVVISEGPLLKFLKKEMKEVVKSIEKEKVPKKIKALKIEKNVLRTLVKNKVARKEFLSRIVTRKTTRIKKVKIKVRGYTRTFRGKKIKVKPHTRTIRKKVKIVRQYLMTG